jgi:hypothetical protein
MAAHIVHHSSDNFNLGTAVRNGWFTIFINLSLCLDSNRQKCWLFAWVVMAVSTAHTYVKKLGFIEKFLKTHTMHQVHHAQNIEYMDKTMVVFLMFLIEFLTWKQLDESITIQYGFLYPDSYNLFVILTHEYKNIWDDMKKSDKWYDKFMYVLASRLEP